MTEDASRAGWLRQARSYLRDADPVLARLSTTGRLRPPRGWPSCRRWTCTVPCCSRSPASSCPSRRPAGPWPASRPCSAASSPPPPNCWPSIPASSARPGCPGGRSAHCATSPGGYRTAGWTRTYWAPARRRAHGRAHRDSRDGPWTVQGALVIALRREDVVLPGDLALRKAIRPPTSWITCHPAGGPAIAEMAALPQPGDKLPVLRRLRAGRGTTGRPTLKRLNLTSSTALKDGDSRG